MDIYPLLLCPDLNLVKHKDNIYIRLTSNDTYYFFCDASKSKIIKNKDLICDVDENIINKVNIKWNESKKRSEYLTNIFHVQTNISNDMACLFLETDIEYELINNNFLLKNEIILNYLIFHDKILLMNNYQKLVGNFFFINKLPVMNLHMNELIKKKRTLIDENKMFIFDVINLKGFIDESYSHDLDVIEQNFCNFCKYFYQYKTTQDYFMKSNQYEKKTIFSNKIKKSSTSLVPYHKVINSIQSNPIFQVEETQIQKYITYENKKKENEISFTKILDKTKDIHEIKIILITFGWNESQILPMFLDYYGNQVDKIIYYDNQSSDNSLEIINNWNVLNNYKVEVKDFDTCHEIRDDILTKNKNNFWKDYISDYDWIIIVDTDEFLVPSQKYKLNIKNLIIEQKSKEIGAIGAIGFQMVSPRYNFHDIRKGTKCNKFDKVCCWNLKLLKEINYSPGCHICDPEFITKDVKILAGNNNLQLRHMKYVGNYDLLLKRLLEYEKRLSNINKKNKWGAQYNINEFKKTYMLYSKKSIDITNF